MKYWFMMISVPVTLVATWLSAVLMVWAMLLAQYDGVFWYGMSAMFFGAVLKILLELDKRWF